METDSAPAGKKRTRRRIVFALLGIVATPIAAILIVYAVLAARFYAHEPRITRNFAAELNAPLLAIPEEERAWPRYRAILLKRRAIPPEFWLSEEYIKSEFSEAEATARKLRELNGHLLAEVREASKIPKLGFLLRDEIDPADYAWYNPGAIEQGYPPDVASDHPAALDLKIPHVSELLEFAIQLGEDAAGAFAAGDTSLAVDDILAILRIAEQLRETPMAVMDLKAFETAEHGLVVFERLLIARPAAFSLNDLLLVERQVAALSDRLEIRPRFGWDRMVVADVIQRAYTDDGEGDGILVERELSSLVLSAPGAPGHWGTLFAPISTLRYAPRREAERLCNELMDLAESACELPLWQWSDREFESRLSALREQDPRYLAVTAWTPHIAPVYLTAQRLIQHRDALLVAIALERFRRDTGDWPNELAQLSPLYLPVVPLDRFDGQPLRYRLIDGSPTLYSVGTDRDDDGGLGSFAPVRWQPKPAAGDASPLPDGDWILWPPPDRKSPLEMR